MGSGHFLVNLVDYLADRVIEAMAEAEAIVKGYVSPLNERIDEIRKTIMARAREQATGASMRRNSMIAISSAAWCSSAAYYGVDKNPMAVELAKVALWLHTFTVGAPLSFLDHHLRCGDSLFGSWVQEGIDRGTELRCFCVSL